MIWRYFSNTQDAAARSISMYIGAPSQLAWAGNAHWIRKKTLNCLIFILRIWSASPICAKRNISSVLRIRDISVRIRIRGSKPLTNWSVFGSGSDSGSRSSYSDKFFCTEQKRKFVFFKETACSKCKYRYSTCDIFWPLIFRTATEIIMTWISSCVWNSFIKSKKSKSTLQGQRNKKERVSA